MKYDKKSRNSSKEKLISILSGEVTRYFLISQLILAINVIAIVYLF